MTSIQELALLSLGCFLCSPKLLIQPNETQFSSMKGWWLHLYAYDFGRDDPNVELSWNYPTDTLRVASLAFGSCRVIQHLRWWLDSRASAQRTQGQLCGLRSPLPPFAPSAHVPQHSKEGHRDLHLLLGEGQGICGHALKLLQHLLVENWAVSFYYFWLFYHFPSMSPISHSGNTDMVQNWKVIDLWKWSFLLSCITNPCLRGKPCPQCDSGFLYQCLLLPPPIPTLQLLGSPCQRHAGAETVNLNSSIFINLLFGISFAYGQKGN